MILNEQRQREWKVRLAYFCFFILSCLRNKYCVFTSNISKMRLIMKILLLASMLLIIFLTGCMHAYEKQSVKEQTLTTGFPYE